MALTETVEWDTFYTATLRNFESTLHKQFLKYRPTVEKLFDNFSLSDSRGGRTWQGIAEHGLAPTVKMFRGAESFSQEVTQTMLPIRQDWVYAGGSVSMAVTEGLENSGAVALADILETRVNQVLRSVNILIGNEIFGDGSNYPEAGTIDGLKKLLAENSTTSACGLDPATYTWWQNNYRTGCGAFATYGIYGASADYIMNMFNACSDGDADRPSFIVCDQGFWEAYARRINYTGAAHSMVTYQKSGEPDGAWKALSYYGIPVIWDRQCPTGYCYMINTKYLKFRIDPRFNLKWTAPLSYPNQLMYTRIVGLRFFLNMTARMFHGVTSGWTY